MQPQIHEAAFMSSEELAVAEMTPRERQFVLDHEADSPEGQLLATMRAADAKTEADKLAAKEALERQEVESRAAQSQHEIDRAQGNLDQRLRRISFQSLYVAGQYPHLVRSPETQQYIHSQLEKCSHIGPSTLELIVQEGIATGALKVDYSEGNKKRFHDEVEAMRASGVNVPTFIEKPGAQWTDADFAESRKLLADVPVSEIQGLTGYLKKHTRKKAALSTEESDLASPPPSMGTGQLVTRTWRTMNRTEKLAAWDKHRESQQ